MFVNLISILKNFLVQEKKKEKILKMMIIKVKVHMTVKLKFKKKKNNKSCKEKKNYLCKKKIIKIKFFNKYL